MPNFLRYFTFFLFTSLLFSLPVLTRSAAATAIVLVDDEYDAYKKKGDDFFKAGRYVEARRQYQNCLEVPGFENDVYAKGQLEKCTASLSLRQHAEEALQQSRGPAAVSLFTQILAINPDDAITKAQLTDYYRRLGNQFFNQKQYQLARDHYTQGLKYATETERQTLEIQIRTINETLSTPISVTPVRSKLVGLKLFTGAAAVGAGVYALLLRNDYQTKRNELNQVSQSVDPDNSGLVNTSDAYQQYTRAYDAAEAASKKNGLFKACVGVAALATVAELYLLLRKSKPRTQSLHIQPAAQSVGLALHYSF